MADPTLEVKFNPYHDPRNGQFTFGPGGAGSADMIRPPKRPQRDERDRSWTGGFNGGGGGTGGGGGATGTYPWPDPTPTKKPARNEQLPSAVIGVSWATTVARKAPGGTDRIHTDDGGHFIAVRFNGPSDSFNHFAQDASFNRGGYRALEDQWARNLRAGKRVSVDLAAYYKGSSRRPSSLSVEWAVNGHVQSQVFFNEPKGKPLGR